MIQVTAKLIDAFGLRDALYAIEKLTPYQIEQIILEVAYLRRSPEQKDKEEQQDLAREALRANPRKTTVVNDKGERQEVDLSKLIAI